MATTSRRLRLTVEWDDEGLPDSDEEGNPTEGGYLDLMLQLGNLGLEVIEEQTV